MENKTATFIYVLIAIIVVYYITTRYIWCEEEIENFDPSLVPVSSIVTLAKVAQKLVDGNGTLTNPGNLTVAGKLTAQRIHITNSGEEWGANLSLSAGTREDPHINFMQNNGVTRNTFIMGKLNEVLIPNNLTVGGNTTINGIAKFLSTAWHTDGEGIPRFCFNANSDTKFWAPNGIHKFETTGGLGSILCNTINSTYVNTSDCCVKHLYGYTGDPEPSKSKNANTPVNVGYSGIRCGMYVWGPTSINGGLDVNVDKGSGIYHFFQDSEGAGRLRVGAAWGKPAIYAADTNTELSLGSNKSIVNIGDPTQAHTLKVFGDATISGGIQANTSHTGKTTWNLGDWQSNVQLGSNIAVTCPNICKFGSIIIYMTCNIVNNDTNNGAGVDLKLVSNGLADVILETYTIGNASYSNYGPTKEMFILLNGTHYSNNTTSLNIKLVLKYGRAMSVSGNFTWFGIP